MSSLFHVQLLREMFPDCQCVPGPGQAWHQGGKTVPASKKRLMKGRLHAGGTALSLPCRPSPALRQLPMQTLASGPRPSPALATGGRAPLPSWCPGQQLTPWAGVFVPILTLISDTSLVWRLSPPPQRPVPTFLYPLPTLPPNQPHERASWKRPLCSASLGGFFKGVIEHMSVGFTVSPALPHRAGRDLTVEDLRCPDNCPPNDWASAPELNAADNQSTSE